MSTKPTALEVSDGPVGSSTAWRATRISSGEPNALSRAARSAPRQAIRARGSTKSRGAATAFALTAAPASTTAATGRRRACGAARGSRAASDAPRRRRACAARATIGWLRAWPVRKRMRPDRSSSAAARRRRRGRSAATGRGRASEDGVAADERGVAERDQLGEATGGHAVPSGQQVDERSHSVASRVFVVVEHEHAHLTSICDSSLRSLVHRRTDRIDVLDSHSRSRMTTPRGEGAQQAAQPALLAGGGVDELHAEGAVGHARAAVAHLAGDHEILRGVRSRSATCSPTAAPRRAW